MHPDHGIPRPRLPHLDDAGPAPLQVARACAMRVCDIMTTRVVTIHPQARFQDVAARLLEGTVSALPVVDEQGMLHGMVTEADLITKEAYADGPHRHLRMVLDHLCGRDPAWVHRAAGRTAEHLMSRPAAVAAPDDDVSVAAGLMLDGHHRCLPVVRDGLLLGIVSRHDLLAQFRQPERIPVRQRHLL